MTDVRMFALISQTPRVLPHELYEMAKALELNARDCAEAWALPKPTVYVCHDPNGIPAGACPVVFVDESTDPGILAEHYWEQRGLRAAARVYVTASSGLNSGPNSVCEGAAHEILEAMADPECNQWVPLPKEIEENTWVALEICDPVQDTYEITVGDTVWNVANFVLPSWFGLATEDDPEHVDFAGSLVQPFSVGMEGYTITYSPSGAEVRPGEFTQPKPGHMTAGSRTLRRMVKTALHPRLAAKTEPSEPPELPPTSLEEALAQQPVPLPPETPEPPPALETTEDIETTADDDPGF